MDTRGERDSLAEGSERNVRQEENLCAVVNDK